MKIQPSLFCFFVIGRWFLMLTNHKGLGFKTAWWVLCTTVVLKAFVKCCKYDGGKTSAETAHRIKLLANATETITNDPVKWTLDSAWCYSPSSRLRRSPCRRILSDTRTWSLWFANSRFRFAWGLSCTGQRMRNPVKQSNCSSSITIHFVMTKPNSFISISISIKYNPLTLEGAISETVSRTMTCNIPADSVWLVGGQKLIQMSIKSSGHHFQSLKKMLFSLVWFPYTNGVLTHFCKVDEILLFWSLIFFKYFLYRWNT